ncbi:MAG: type IV pilus twitching motility protein PilT [Gemmatimonas sp.]|uniref:type IV pilus twitching motility protein PilT n=1 Tax=Gemmatimonas sp. TaxID=1962908 RepID=UPI0022BEC979|nr:PilT/PilU family type 4a pilus ATPase [Gemmatimonas sp.]MCZ8012834.1 PilT/PilU family type 4a pilus ATPase [Gemmatimonas sp.]MCZ8268210.1 PilT/PilU family type 4a pilus ATPase [Gemmatimonas sp.]
MAIERIIKAAVERGASDVHIKSGNTVRARIDGRLVVLTKQALTAEQTRAIALHLMSSDADRATIDTLRDYDCAWAAPGVGRFRVNILRQRASHSIVMRVIPETVPTVQSLGLPPVLTRIAHSERGMVLVTGVTGSGKSSTMAALVNEINASYEKHILTLENPIEFIHDDLKSSVTQREVGIDTDTFRMGLRAALRQDPDVILIGEMRDAETIDTSMKAAETGHLLISTLHTPDAVTTVMRIVAMFPPEEQQVVRMRLAESLHAVVSQRLLPRKSGQGRVVAAEVMINTGTIRDLIAEGRLAEIRDYLADGSQYGMQTFDQHLTELVQGNVVDYEVAKGAATNPADFELSFRMGRSRKTPIAGQTIKPTAMPGLSATTRPAVPAPAPLGANPLGTGPRLPPLGTSPSGQGAVTSPSPLESDSIFGSGFESLFGQ